MLKRFYYAEGRIRLILDKEFFKCGALPLIWGNQGMYGIISKEKVENMIQNLEDMSKLPVLEKMTYIGKFFWDEVETIDPKTAKLLFGGK